MEINIQELKDKLRSKAGFHGEDEYSELTVEWRDIEEILDKFPESTKSAPTWKDQVEELFSDEPQGCGKRFKLGKIDKLFVCGMVTKDNPFAVLCDKCKEDKIEGHTKISMDAYDKGVKHGLQFREDSKLEPKKYAAGGMIGKMDYLEYKHEDVQDTKSEPKGVYIERAAKLDKEGIRAVCGTDEEYNEYVKKNAEDTKSEPKIEFIKNDIVSLTKLAKEMKKGCGKMFMSVANIQMPCGEIGGGREQFCDECEEKFEVQDTKEVIKNIQNDPEAVKQAKDLFDESDLREENKILKGWIIRNYGSECEEFEENCATCQCWKFFNEFNYNDLEDRESVPILWLRKLSCGHSRPTNLAFMSQNYEKPKIDSMCFCRECNEDVEVLIVEKCQEGDKNAN